MKHQCPDEEILAAYFEGLLSASEEAALQATLAECPDCVERVGALGLILRAEAPDAWRNAPAVPARATQRAMDLWPTNPVVELTRLAVRFLGRALAPLTEGLAPMPALAGAVRGHAATESLRYRLEAGGADWEVMLAADGPERLTLQVRPPVRLEPGWRVRLRQGGETFAVSAIDGAGAVVPDLSPGVWTLLLERGGQDLARIELSLVTDEKSA